MSRDIRSFFTTISKKRVEPTKNVSKKTKRLIDSDDEEFVGAISEKSPSKKKSQKVKKEVLSSDSEDESLKCKPANARTGKVKQDKTLLEPVDIADVFNNTPIKQSKVEIVEKSLNAGKDVDIEKKKTKSRKSTEGTELGIHNDIAFEKTLVNLDEEHDLFQQTLTILDEAEKEAFIHEEENGVSNEIKESKYNLSAGDKTKKEYSKSEKKRFRSDSTENTPKKRKVEHTDLGIDPGQEAYEKKKYSAMLYQKYLNRSGPKYHGMKELPKGKPDCLKNFTFLRTGVLDSLESEEFNNLIKEHGGRVVYAVSKKVNYVVVGDDPGPAKLAKAESLGIPNISEDELLDLILVKSGMDPKYCKKHTSFDSGDSGNEVNNPTKTTSEKEKPIQKKEDENIVPKSANKFIDSTKQQNTMKTFHSKPSMSKLSDTEPQLKPIEKEKSDVDQLVLSLTEKYKPKDIKGIIGQQSEGSIMHKLKYWLQNWDKNQDHKMKKSLIKPSPWTKKDDGAYFKCALLSGPPGIGKTTTATLVAQSLGLDIVEFNASDTRSKKLLHDEVSNLLSNTTIAGFVTGQHCVSKKRVLLMDEVDGMAGNEDRGGIQELILLIKNSSVPVICMCNDRNHPKIRSLANYCFDLRFTKPKLEQIRGAMMSICFKENIKIQGNALTEIITGTGCDVRQTLNHLAVLSVGCKSITIGEATKEAKASKKDTIMGPWEVCRSVFTESEQRNMSVADKARLFFYDYSIGPLFVQENYLKVQPLGKLNEKQTLKRAMLVTDAVSIGDLIDSKIRRSNNWALLEYQSIFSSVLPGHFMSGNFVSQINFPGWLGKNSKKNKFNRLLCEIQTHSHISTSATKMAIKLDYLVPLKNSVLLPLKNGMDGISKAVSVMKTYNLLREDFDSLLELCHWQRGENQMDSIETKVKTAFTRTYNKEVTLLPYALTSGITKKKLTYFEAHPLGEEEIVESDNEDDDDISKNAMIKVKKPSAHKSKNTFNEMRKKKPESAKGKGKKKA